MLKIRPAQLQAFQQVAEAAFVGRVVAHLRAHHAGTVVRLPSGETTVAALPDDTLRELVAGGLTRARRYGIEWESNLTAFVVLMFTAAPNFDAHPIIQHVLTNAQTPPESRIDRLWEDTTEENWEAAEAAYDVNAWGLGATGGQP